MAEWRSQYCTTDNQYILFRIWVRETAVDVIANTSTIRITVYAWRTNEYTTNYGGGCNVKIDGVARGYQYWDWGQCPVYYDSDTVLYDESNIVIPHNADGTKTINVAATCEWYADGSIKIDSSWQSFDVTLTAIDRGAPSVYHSISNVGVSSFTINASTNSNCDMWDYSIDNGANWTRFSNTVGTSASVTVSGLSPNTTYNTRVRARRQYNTVWGYYGPVAVKTLGNSILNSVATITADAATVTVSFNATVYVPGYKHTLEFNRGDTYGTMISLTNLTLANGANTVTLTASQRNTLLNNFPNTKTFTVSVSLYTYSGSTLIGSVSTKTCTAQTTAANSSPTFTGFTYSDVNSTTTSVTGNNQVLIQGYSSLRVIANAATAKNGASIKSYSVVAGSSTASSTSTTINVGAVNNTGTVAVTVSAVDSRGYSTSRSVNVSVLAYSKIRFKTSNVRRVNEIENTIQLSFTGFIQSLSVGGTDKNALQACQYRYKKTSDSSYGSYTNITSGVTRSGNNLSYSNASLVNLDANYSWNLQIYLQDKLTTDTITLTVSQGIPLVTFRTKKVGINVRNPSRSLDVAGNGIKSQPGTGVSYISGCAGNGSGLYVSKDQLNVDHWIPGITIQTKAGGGWAIGNYSNESLEFAYGTKANIDANNNVVSHVFLTMDGTNTSRWICTTANGPANNLVVVGDGTTAGIKNSGYGITTTVSSSQTTSLVTSAGVWNMIASRTLMRDPFVASSTSYNVDNMRGATRFVYTTHNSPFTGTVVSLDSSDSTNYTIQIGAQYSTGRFMMRSRNGDQNAWVNWVDIGQRYQYPTMQGGKTATYYIQTSMRGSSGADSMYLLSCPTAGGTGSLYLLRPDTYSSQKMKITAIVAGTATVSQVSDPWGFSISSGGYATTPSVIRL